MIRSPSWSVAAAFAFLLPTVLSASEPSPQAVFHLVGERLQQMRAVALYKAQHGLAVEDPAREDVVLDMAQESAAAAGLDPATVASFYRLQIQAAKAVQYRYLADWALAHPDALSQSTEDLDTVIRPRLLELGAALTSALRAFLEARGCFRPDHLPLFLDTIDVEHLSEAEETLLFESMAGIDLAPPHAQCAAVGSGGPMRIGAPYSSSVSIASDTLPPTTCSSSAWTPAGPARTLPLRR